MFLCLANKNSLVTDLSVVSLSLLSTLKSVKTARKYPMGQNLSRYANYHFENFYVPELCSVICISDLVKPFKQLCSDYC